MWAVSAVKMHPADARAMTDLAGTHGKLRALSLAHDRGNVDQRTLCGRFEEGAFNARIRLCC